MRQFFLRALFFLGLLWSGNAISGVDLAKGSVPTEVGDGKVSNGTRTLQLPPGHWTHIAKVRGDITRNQTTVIGHSHTGYVIHTAADQFLGGIALSLIDDSVDTHQWILQPCNETKNILYKNDYDSGYQTPECLLIFKWKTHLKNSAGNFYPQAAAWVASNKIVVKGPIYEVFYSKYAFNEMGWVRVFIPATEGVDDKSVVKWAEGLSPKLKDFFERRVTFAELPPLPTSNKQ